MPKVEGNCYQCKNFLSGYCYELDINVDEEFLCIKFDKVWFLKPHEHDFRKLGVKRKIGQDHFSLLRCCICSKLALKKEQKVNPNQPREMSQA